MISDALKKLIARENISRAEAEACMEQILSGNANDALIALPIAAFNLPSVTKWRGPLLFLGFGAWSLYASFRGIVPNSRTLWGKSKAGQRMKIGQRILFGTGGVLLIGVGILMFWVVTR